MQFTEKFIKSLKPNADQKKFYDVRERSGQGFGISVFPSGNKSFIFIYHYAGRKRRMTLGKYPQCTLADARRLHREALKMLEKEKDPALEKRKQEIETRESSSVEGLIEEYMEKWAKPRKRSWQADERLLNKDVKPIWGKRKAKDVTRRDVILLLDKVKERGAPIAANRTLACVRRMFNFAVERDIIPISPCVAVKAVAKENRRDRVLTADEIKNFWLALDKQDKLVNGEYAIQMSETSKIAIKLQLVTAQRKGEIVGAEWCEIDLISGWWMIPGRKAKNGQAHRVPLSKLALELLKEIKQLHDESPWVFPSDKTVGHITPAAIDHAIRRCTIENVQPFTPHDLRRTAASHMTSMGISRLVVSKLLNHVENSVTAIYDRHSYDTEKRNALEAWDRRLREIISGIKPETNVISFEEAV
jgi:integrase